MTTPELQEPLYGEYNWDDPIYKVLRRETASPRYKLYLIQHGVLDIIFYQYTDALALKSRAGTNFDELLRKQRRVLVEEGITTDANEELKKNFSETQTPYTDLEEEDWHYGTVWCG